MAEKQPKGFSKEQTNGQKTLNERLQDSRKKGK